MVLFADVVGRFWSVGVGWSVLVMVCVGWLSVDLGTE